MRDPHLYPSTFYAIPADRLDNSEDNSAFDDHSSFSTVSEDEEIPWILRKWECC